MKTINMQNLKKIKNRKVNYNEPNIKDKKKKFKKNPKTTTNNFF
jgi:hypothetical protein